MSTPAPDAPPEIKYFACSGCSPWNIRRKDAPEGPTRPIPAPGNVLDLLAELDALGIRLEANGDRLRFQPREAVTVDLAARMKTHKAELLALLAKRETLSRRIAEQLAALVPYRTPEGRPGWVNPRCQRELERLGLL